MKPGAMEQYARNIALIEPFGTRMYLVTLTCSHQYITDDCPPAPGEFWCEKCWIAAGAPFRRNAQ